MNEQITAVSRTLRANNEQTLERLNLRLGNLLQTRDLLDAEIRDVRESIFSCETVLRQLPAAPVIRTAPAPVDDAAAESEAHKALTAAMEAELDPEQLRRA